MTPSAYAIVTEHRRKLILQALAVLGSAAEPGGTVKQINERIQLWIDRGTATWPPAPWDHARNEPYYTGTLQHLQALDGKGFVDNHRGWWRPTGLRARAVDVMRLASEGKSGSEIAKLLGISTSLASSLLNDPTGEHEKERKRGYCMSCGAKKKPEATVCLKCRDRPPEELLPPNTFTVYCERAQRHGYELAFGVTPELKRVIRIGTARGFFDHEVRSDVEWIDGVSEVQEELGIELI